MKDVNNASAMIMQSNDQDIFEVSCKAYRNSLVMPFKVQYPSSFLRRPHT